MSQVLRRLSQRLSRGSNNGNGKEIENPLFGKSLEHNLKPVASIVLDIQSNPSLAKLRILDLSDFDALVNAAEYCKVCDVNKHVISFAESIPNQQPIPIAVLSWRWDIKKPQSLQEAEQLPTSKKIAEFLQQAQLRGAKYAWVDWMCVPQYSNENEIVDHVKASYALYTTASVIIVDKHELLPGLGLKVPTTDYMTRLWTNAEQSAMGMNPHVTTQDFVEATKPWNFHMAREFLAISQQIGSYNLFSYKDSTTYNMVYPVEYEMNSLGTCIFAQYGKLGSHPDEAIRHTFQALTQVVFQERFKDSNNMPTGTFDVSEEIQQSISTQIMNKTWENSPEMKALVDFCAKITLATLETPLSEESKQVALSFSLDEHAAAMFGLLMFAVEMQLDKNWNDYAYQKVNNTFEKAEGKGPYAEMTDEQIELMGCDSIASLSFLVCSFKEDIAKVKTMIEEMKSDYQLPMFLSAKEKFPKILDGESMMVSNVTLDQHVVELCQQDPFPIQFASNLRLVNVSWSCKYGSVLEHDYEVGISVDAMSDQGDRVILRERSAVISTGMKQTAMAIAINKMLDKPEEQILVNLNVQFPTGGLLEGDDRAFESFTMALTPTYPSEDGWLSKILKKACNRKVLQALDAVDFTADNFRSELESIVKDMVVPKGLEYNVR